MSVKLSIDNPIRLRRVALGIAQTKLARDVGIAVSTLQALEDGRTAAPSPETTSMKRTPDSTSRRAIKQPWPKLPRP